MIKKSLSIGTYRSKLPFSKHPIKTEPSSPVLSQIAVLREGDLFKTWSPMISGSEVLKRISESDHIAQLIGAGMGLPGREVTMRVFGCNLLHEGLLVMMGRSVNAEDFLTEEELEAFRCGQHPKAHIHYFRMMVEIVSVESIQLTVMSKVGLRYPYVFDVKFHEMNQ